MRHSIDAIFEHLSKNPGATYYFPPMQLLLIGWKGGLVCAFYGDFKSMPDDLENRGLYSLYKNAAA